MTSDFVKGEHGSIAAFLALLGTALFVLVGLVVDGGRVLAARRDAIDVAEQAARLGADQLSVDGLRSGRYELDPSAATSAVNGELRAYGLSGDVTISEDSVTVRV